MLIINLNHGVIRGNVVLAESLALETGIGRKAKQEGSSEWVKKQKRNGR